MRLALFSPLPPARSGIADYSEALLGALREQADVAVFDAPAAAFNAAQFDIPLYQIGNNGYHSFVYEAALRHPGVVVLHEANLHHLLTDLTLKRGEWDAYVQECEYNGGAAAREYAERVRRLEVGPDYDGLPMTRRLLEAACGVIVHSRFMERAVREAGFEGPVAVIPHGAWIPEASGRVWRERLGVSETAALTGIFGFLKPYKRITESLRAFRRLVRLQPEARMILVGEPHPGLPIGSLIQSLGLSSHARVMGFAAPEDFVELLAACDIVLNLRYPTVGESSGTLMRAMGLGKAVLVSEVGAFAELPDGACLKVPVGAGEEDLIFEYLNLLVSRPEVARTLGAGARQYVERECNWHLVAGRYLAFCQAVAEGREWTEEPVASATAAEVPQPVAAALVPEQIVPYLQGWAANRESREYLATHQTRLAKTLAMTPQGNADARVLEMGAYLQITPALRSRLGYGEVRGCYYGPAGTVERREVVSDEGERFACDVDLFDAEHDAFPYPGEYFSTVLCCELIEHLTADPMHMMAEINRILKPGGHLVLTTPNIASERAIAAILLGYHPGFFPSYIRPRSEGETEARHNREYTPKETEQLLDAAGFDTERIETGEFRELPHPELAWVRHLLDRYSLDKDLRGDGLFALAKKRGPVKQRYPEWLYS
jgi:glycosyltransferase involved in cell wall biosynthesis/SAM-dependent methyltransferase